MTRKRYVKLLMSCGVERNLANQCAKEARREGKTYEHSLAELLDETVSFFEKIVSAMASTAGLTTEPIAAAVLNFADAVGDFYGQ